MSNSNCCKSSIWPTIALVIGGFSVFALILLIAYLPQAPEALPEGVKSPAERVAVLSELRAKEKTAASTYGWVDQSKGVVRLPIERAVELTLQDLSIKR